MSYNPQAANTFTYVGNPNGFVAGNAASGSSPPDYCWDPTNHQLWTCVTTGSTSSAVWVQSTQLIKNALVSTAQSIGAAQSGTTYVAIASLTLTYGVTTGLGTNFEIWGLADGGDVIHIPNAADKINGGTAGASVTVPMGWGWATTTDGAGNLYIGMYNATLGIGTLASAATTDLGSVGADNITVSGTTTITSLGSSSPAGIRKRVTFSGALTLTYNATSLILPNAANITTAAGDSAEFQSLGSGNWRCVSYTPATASNDPTYADNSGKPASTSWVRGAMSAIATAAGFAYSFGGTAGYIKFPSWLGGWMVQWGSATISTANAAQLVSYPTNFPTGALNIWGSSSSTGSYGGAILNNATSGYVFSNNAGAAIYYIVVGH